MSDWRSLLLQPLFDCATSLEDWFSAIATHLLNGVRLMVGTAAHRLTELEFYYHTEGHLDPFAHRDPIQRDCGRWYFHRSHGVYRNGSFKGLDVTFGGVDSFAGILIRSLETPEGKLVDGPSLCVDYLLAKTGFASVASLDQAITGRLAWDTTSPLALEWLSPSVERPTYRSARVGLSLRRAASYPDMIRFLVRPYRYLTEPRRIRKGKAHLVLTLHAQQIGPEAIHQMTGCPRRTIQAYLADFEEGRSDTDVTRYYGTDLGPRDLCRLHGALLAPRR
jgi:hypothetical protein